MSEEIQNTEWPVGVDRAAPSLGEQMENERKELEAYVSDPENRRNATSLALQVQDVCGKKWFTFKKFLSKTMESKEAGLLKMNALRTFDMVAMKPGDDGQPLFKVMVNKEDRLSVIDEQIEFHQTIINQLNAQRQQIAGEN